MITFVNTSKRLAPKSRAASISDGFISASFGRTIKTTIGMLNAICDNNTEVNPRLIPAIVNKIKNEAPMMTSGLTISTLFNPRIVFWRFFIKWMASAPNVPMIVANNAERRAITIVFKTMVIKRTSSNTSM